MDKTVSSKVDQGQACSGYGLGIEVRRNLTALFT